jgi:hypothetical protein
MLGYCEFSGFKISRITLKTLYSLVLPEPLILNQKSSGGNNLKCLRYTRQGHLKRPPNLERAHGYLMS